MLEGAKNLFSGRGGSLSEQSPNILEDIECCSLTWKQRVYGFGFCMAAGIVISFTSSIAFALGNITGFAILYSLGNIISLCSTGFLMGPLTQLKRMFDKTRIIATFLFLLTLALTITFAALKLPVVLILVMIGLQMLALLWYSLSYIPYARTLAKKMFGGMA